MYHYAAFAGLMLSVSTATASSMFSKRDSWGPAFSLGPAKQEIISTTTTIYPGQMPADQAGYLFVWLGISNGTGDLIQSIIGSYPAGGSECSGSNADTTWCISSEVYGLASNGYPNQWVGDLTTADVNFANGIKLNYTLIDKESYLWLQTMEDAVTGQLLSTFNKTSGPMLGWGTAIECNDNNGVACTGTIAAQAYINSTIILESADATFIETMGAGTGVTHSQMETADNGKTWTIAKINLPAMQSSPAASAVVASSSTAALAVAIKSSSAITHATTSSSQIPVPTKSAQPISTNVKVSTLSTATRSRLPATSSAPASSLVTPTTAASSSAVTTKTKHHGHTSKHSGN